VKVKLIVQREKKPSNDKNKQTKNTIKKTPGSGTTEFQS
jgi:hypothetical protein